jgi:hypothetical protein
MPGPRLLLCGVSIFAFAATVLSQPHSDPWKSLASEPEWKFNDPAYLYLRFRDKGLRGESLTWVHPIHHRSNWVEEVFMPGHEHDARAFAYHLIRETPEGYEVSFQPIDPIDPSAKRPLPLKDIRVFFPRSKPKLFSLTDKLSVLGFYGNPRRPRP